jgi:uncharacterized protein
MALVNQAKHEINAKIVFFGPGLAGKSTSLKHIYNKLKPEFRGPMKAMNVQDARMLFFDFTPPGDGNVDGFRVRFHVYTVSGNQVDPSAWKMVLKGVDGIVFVADCHPERQEANRESLDNLASYVKSYGQNLSSIPVVFQYNKNDLPDAQGAGEMDRSLNPSRQASFRACSQTGEGVLQTMLSLVKTVLSGLRSKGVEGLATPEALQRMVEPSAPMAAPATPATSAAPAAPAEPEAPAAPAEPEAAVEAAPPVEPEPQVEQRFTAGAETAQAASEAEEEPLSVEIAGAPEAGDGVLRLPLTIRSGARTKSVVLAVSVSLEEE